MARTTIADINSRVEKLAESVETLTGLISHQQDTGEIPPSSRKLTDEPSEIEDHKLVKGPKGSTRCFHVGNVKTEGGVYGVFNAFYGNKGKTPVTIVVPPGNTVQDFNHMFGPEKGRGLMLCGMMDPDSVLAKAIFWTIKNQK